MVIANPLLFTLDWWNTTCNFGCFLCRSAILLSRQSRKECYHSLVERTKEKTIDRKQKPAESTTLTKINWVILMNMTLLSNRKPKQQGETFNLPGMLCSICIGSSKANPFTSGCINFRTLTLTRHVESHYADLTFFFSFSQAKTSVSPKNWKVPLNCWLGQNVPLKWIPDQTLN